MADILKRVNRTRVTAELLGEAVEMHGDLPPENRSAAEVCMVRLLEMLNRRGLGKKIPDMVLAIEFRLYHVAERRKDTAARVVGIGDWAWQRGCRYGTIMVDLERREVVDVLFRSLGGGRRPVAATAFQARDR